jgi:hypothetical protein
MPIDGGQRGKLEAGTKLVARYRKEEHTAEVVVGEDGQTLYRLADGREFKSPSAAGSAVMGGVACNGWRFWSLASDTQDGTPAEPKAQSKPKATAMKASGKKASPKKQAEPEPESAAEPVTTEDESPEG